MKITGISSYRLNNYKQSFGNALSSEQEKKYTKLRDKSRELQGHQNGIRVVKLYTPALPRSDEFDTGTGKITSPEAKRFYEIAKVYGGATMIKFMPMGNLSDKSSYNDNHYPGAYHRGAFTLGEDIIDITQLATKKYGNILSQRDIKNFINRHRQKNMQENQIDFETTLGWKNQEDYPVNEILRTAFSNFKDAPNPNSELEKMRKEFEEFKNQKEPVDYDDIYTRIALFPYLKDWSNARTDFFVGFDSDPEIRKQKMPIYEQLKITRKDEIDFFKFKQFLAHKTLKEAKKTINDLGMDLQGDCPATFSWAEEQVFPDAFLKDEKNVPAEMGWGIHVLNCHDLIEKDDSPAHRLLKAKVAHFLNCYDGVRFDVGWYYMSPTYHFSYGHKRRLDAGNKITDFIENIAREIKGDDYDFRKLTYECDASEDDFSLWDKKFNIKHNKGLAILSTEEEKNDSANMGWASLPFIKYDIGLDNDDFIIGTNNHDKEGILRCAKNKVKSSEQVGALLRVFNLRFEPYGYLKFKDDSNLHEHIKKYTKGRFAEIDLAKNTFLLFTDLLGREEKVDYHTNGTGYQGEKDYKNRLERDYEKHYHEALQDDVGYNEPDVKSFRMELDHTDSQYRDVYEKLRKYALYLKQRGGIYTRDEADKSPLGKLDIESMSEDDIKRLNIQA